MAHIAKSSSSKLLACAAGVGVILVAGSALAATPDGAKGAGTLVAVLHPVDKASGAVNSKITLGTARFTAGKEKVEVLVQVAGLSVAGSEPGVSADGQGNVYPRGVRIVAATSCEPADQAKASGSQSLPDLNLQSDGAGVLMASTATAIDQLAGRTVVVIRSDKPGSATGAPIACGVIQGR